MVRLRCACVATCTVLPLIGAPLPCRLLRQPDEFVLKRRQELPEDAFVPNERAVTLLSERRVAVLSYRRAATCACAAGGCGRALFLAYPRVLPSPPPSPRWLTAEHPDKFPGSDGFHMTAVRDFLRRGLTWLEWVSLMWHGGEFSSPKALFWDYASLHQKDKNGQKTEVETAQFKKALDVMTYGACAYISYFYATPPLRAICWCFVPFAGWYLISLTAGDDRLRSLRVSQHTGLATQKSSRGFHAHHIRDEWLVHDGGRSSVAHDRGRRLVVRAYPWLEAHLRCRAQNPREDGEHLP